MVALLAFAAVAAAQEGKDAGQKSVDRAQKATEDAPKVAQGAGVEAKAAGSTAQGEQIAEQLAAKLRAAGVACTGYGPGTYGLLDADYGRRLPPVAAVTSCNTEDDEDITFEVFEDTARARQYVDTKREYLCKRAAGYGLEHFPGFPYVAADNWVVEPDGKDTAEKLAPILGGKANMAACDTK